MHMSCSNEYITKDVTSPQKKKEMPTSRKPKFVAVKGVLYMYGGETSGKKTNSGISMHGYMIIYDRKDGREGMRLRQT